MNPAIPSLIRQQRAFTLCRKLDLELDYSGASHPALQSIGQLPLPLLLLSFQDLVDRGLPALVDVDHFMDWLEPRQRNIHYVISGP